MNELERQRDARIFDILEIKQERFRNQVIGVDDLSLQEFLYRAMDFAVNHGDVSTMKLNEDYQISCVNWKGKRYISGTDVVRFLTYRYELFTGRPPLSIKKYEEGVFSDLRRLQPPKDGILEPTRSEFLVFLFNHDCVRSKKKQKVFFWTSFINIFNNMFCDAVERELARREMARAVGLTVDEFIKSGIVPTGTNSNIVTTDLSIPGVFDWTIPAYSQVMGMDLPPEQRGMMTMDQVHIIRNDIGALLNKELRMPLARARSCITPELLLLIDERLKSSVGKGKAIRNDSFESNDDPEEGQVQKSKRGPKPKRSYSPSKTNSPSPRIESKRKRNRINEESLDNPFPSQLNFDALPNEDNYSASTLSSDDDEVRIPLSSGYIRPSNDFWPGRRSTFNWPQKSYSGILTPYEAQINAAKERKARLQFGMGEGLRSGVNENNVESAIHVEGGAVFPPESPLPSFRSLQSDEILPSALSLINSSEISQKEWDAELSNWIVPQSEQPESEAAYLLFGLSSKKE